MTPDKQQSEPDKPPIEQAINWLASHSGEYSKQIIDAFASLREKEAVLTKENALLKKEIKSAYDSLNNNIVAMQCCVIETEHNGHEAGYTWIWNTLCGPGLIPEPEEEWYESAQLYWNANNSEPYGPCGMCGKPSNISAYYGASCCWEHDKQLKEKNQQSSNN